MFHSIRQHFAEQRLTKVKGGLHRSLARCVRLHVEELEIRCLLATFNFFPLTAAAPDAVGIAAVGITAGPDGNLWFNVPEYSINPNGNVTSAIGRITTGGSISLFSIPRETDNGGVTFGPPLPGGGITAGPDGNIWYTGFGGLIPGPSYVSTNIDYITTNGTFPSDGFGTPGDTSSAGEITTGPNGNLWFTDYNLDQIGEITTGGSVTEFPLPKSIIQLTGGITAGPDGNVWFAEGGYGSKIGRITPAGAITQFPIPSGGDAYGITSGADGNLWFMEGGNPTFANIGRITPAGTITEFPIPSGDPGPGSICAGLDGNLYFTEPSNYTIGQITPQGVITEIPIPIDHSQFPQPGAITAGSDGNIWFTMGGLVDGEIGQLVLGSLQSTVLHLAVVNQPPSQALAGTKFDVKVAVEDQNGNLQTNFTGPVELTLLNNPGNSTLAGTLTQTAVNGVADFPDLSLNNAGTGYTLNATSNSANSVTTNSFDVIAPPIGSHFVITTQPPSSVGAGRAFGFVVAEEDGFGNIVTSFNGTLTTALGANPGNSTLSGKFTVVAVQGVATFSGLSLNNAANGYTLIAFASNAQAVTTDPFNVTAVVPTPPTIIAEHVVISQQKNKKGKPVGKPTLVGYTIDYSTAMNEATIGNPANYVVDQFVTVRQKQGKKKKTVLVPQAIGSSVSSITTDSVTLKLAGSQKFSKGGEITVIASPPNGVENTSGVFLSANAVLYISPGGKGITRVSQ